MAAVAGVAGFTSGLVAYGLGLAAGLPAVRRIFGPRLTERVAAAYARYGPWALVLSAFGLVPFSVVCWLAGAYRMPMRRFALTVLLTRTPRHVLVAYCGAAVLVPSGLPWP